MFATNFLIANKIFEAVLYKFYIYIVCNKKFFVLCMSKHWNPSEFPFSIKYIDYKLKIVKIYLDQKCEQIFMQLKNPIEMTYLSE